ncbi:hypothetical protein [Dactylosporangium sp. NPDC005555]
MERLSRPAGMPPVNGYSHVVRFSGELVAVSGQVPQIAIEMRGRSSTE